MGRKSPRCERPWMVAVVLVMVAGLTVFTSGQQGRLADPRDSLHVPILTFGPEGPAELEGLPDDWSHHHLVFSNPGTEEDAIRNGKYDEWLKIVNDPRYIMQQLKRRSPAQGPSAEYVARMNDMARAQESAGGEDLAAGQLQDSLPLVKDPRPAPRAAIHRDWSMDFSSASVGAGMFPAKYSFSTTGTAYCADATTPDFVVYNTGVAGSSTAASIVAYDNLYSSCSGQAPSVYWAFNTGAKISTSVVLSGNGSQVAFVQTPSSGNAQLVLLTWAAKPTGRTVKGTVTIGSKNFSLTSGTLTGMDVGAGISGGGMPTGDTIATVTSGTAGTLFTAAGSGGTSGENLAITADGGSPDTLTAVSASSYSGCTAPCMTTLNFSGTSRSDSISSPYYDYGSDTLYVGDASGGLHKFHPVFSGTPAEVGTPWVAVSSAALSSPVYDATSGNVFAGDASGYLYSVNSSGTSTKSVQVAASPGIVDGPLVDASAAQLYAFVGQDYNSTNSSTSPCASGNSGSKTVCNGVIQLPASFGSSTEFTESVMGVGTTNTLFAGAFDNLYWTTGAGNIYASGATGTNYPKLMEIPVTTNGFSTKACQSGTGLPTNCSALQCATNIVTMTSAAAAGSPVTEICNNGASACTSTSTDYIFTSVSASGNLSTTGCATGNACVYSWNTTSTLGANAAPAAGLVAAGGSSGIIIDNTLSTTGASQVYFSTLGASGTCTTSGGTGGCAVQASQSALH